MIKNPLLLSATICAALTTTLPGQTSAQSSANRFIPANSSAVMRMASPAKFGAQFQATQAAKLLQADGLAPFVGMATQQMEVTMDMLRDSGMFDAELLDGLLSSWQGDLVMSVQVDWDGIADAMQYSEMPSFSIVIALTPDGSFDLSAVAKEFERMIENDDSSATNLKDLVIGDVTMRRQDNNGEAPDVVLPFMMEDHLVVLIGSDLEQKAAKLLAKDSRFSKTTDGASLYADIRLSEAMDLMLGMEDPGGPVDPAAMMDTIGLSALEGFTMTMKPQGKAVIAEWNVNLAQEGRGMFNAFMSGSKQPKLLRSVPANSENFSVSSMDIAPIYNVIADLWTMAEEMAPITFDEAMETFTDATKVRMKEDLLDHMGKELLSITNISAVTDGPQYNDPDDISAMFTGVVWGMELRDGAAFAKSLETVIRSRGMHIGRKKEDYANATINRMKLAGLIELEYVIDRDILLISAGGDEITDKILRDVLDTRASGEASLPSIVQTHASDFPSGWTGFSATQPAAILEGVVAALQASGEFGSEIDMVAQITKGIVKDMDILGINSLLQASYADEDGMKIIMRW
jgi:hypothetical protein